MKKKYPVILSEAQREQLKSLIAAGSDQARKPQLGDGVFPTFCATSFPWRKRRATIADKGLQRKTTNSLLRQSRADWKEDRQNAFEAAEVQWVSSNSDQRQLDLRLLSQRGGKADL